MGKESLALGAIEGAGRIIGAVGRKIRFTEKRYVKSARIEANGIENLASLAGIPFLLVANPIEPEDGGLEFKLGPFRKKTGWSIDYPFVDYQVSMVNNSQVRDVINYGWPPGRLEKIMETLARSILIGYKKVPIDRKDGHEQDLSPDPGFYEEFDKAVKGNHPILMFTDPRGYHKDDKVYSPQEIDTLIPQMAKTYGLPIVVVRIAGANCWERGLNVKLSFDEPFEVRKDMPDENIQEEIAERLENLRIKQAA